MFCCEFGQNSTGCFFLLHVALTEATWQFSAGRWSQIEGVQWLYSYVQCLDMVGRNALGSSFSSCCCRASPPRPSCWQSDILQGSPGLQEKMSQEAGNGTFQSHRPGQQTGQHHFCQILLVKVITESSQIQAQRKKIPSLTGNRVKEFRVSSTQDLVFLSLEFSHQTEPSLSSNLPNVSVPQIKILHYTYQKQNLPKLFIMIIFIDFRF